MHRTTILLPDDLYERLRRESFAKKKSVASLIRERLTEVSPKEEEFTGPHPLDSVIGIASAGGLTTEIDEDLYG
jgi:hypothetical protein